MIYLDNAATTQKKPEVVIRAVTEAMTSFGNAGRGVHEASLGAARMIFETRSLLSDFFDGDGPAQLVFTANSTESLNIAIKGLLKAGDHAITTVLDHNSVLRPLYELAGITNDEDIFSQALDHIGIAKGGNTLAEAQEQKIELSIIGCDKKGMLDYDSLEAAIRPQTRAIICTHGSNLTGNLVDIERVGKIAKAHDILFVVDASQTAGVFPIDVKKCNVDVLCFTGHKSLLGPQGTGGMLVREGLNIKPLITGGSGVQTYSKTHPKEMPTALEAGTLNSHGIAGLNAAVTYIEETGIDNIRAREQQLMWRFYNGIKDLDGVTVYGDFDENRERCPIVALNIGDYDSSQVSDELAISYGIATRSGAHCAPLMHQALGTVSRGAVRFSFSYFNTEEEIDVAIRAVREMAEV